MLKWLEGKKTYITAILLVVYNVGIALGWWTMDNEIIIAINTVLAGFGLGFLRAGVAKAKE